METVLLYCPKFQLVRQRTGQRQRRKGRKGEQQKRGKEEADMIKKDNSVQKDYYHPSPVYDSSLKKMPYPLLTHSCLPQKKKEEEEEKKSDPVKDYYPPSPVYTLSYEEDAPTLVNNLVPTSAPVTKENIKDKPKGEDNKEDKDDGYRQMNTQERMLMKTIIQILITFIYKKH